MTTGGSPDNARGDIGHNILQKSINKLCDGNHTEITSSTPISNTPHDSGHI